MADLNGPDPNLSGPVQFSDAISIETGKSQQNLRM